MDENEIRENGLQIGSQESQNASQESEENLLTRRRHLSENGDVNAEVMGFTFFCHSLFYGQN